MKLHWRKFLSVFIFITVGVFFAFFSLSGGYSLVRLYREYLSQDIADKKYSFADFTDRGPRAKMSGYYAGRVGDSVYIWTYSGLKRFTGVRNTSIYYWLDTCGLISSRTETADERISIEPWFVYDMDKWENNVRRGDYVWVTRVGEKEDSRNIDKIWASDSKHYPYRGVTLSECQKR